MQTLYVLLLPAVRSVHYLLVIKHQFIANAFLKYNYSGSNKSGNVYSISNAFFAILLTSLALTFNYQNQLTFDNVTM
jgi:hypothetical protein